MSEMKRLLELAEKKSRAEAFTSARVRMLRSDSDAMRRLLESDGITLNVLFNAVVRGYIGRHPAVLAMLDDEVRRNAKPLPKGPRVSERELDEIYAALGSGMMEAEDSDAND
jgi:hypothetical protein